MFLESTRYAGSAMYALVQFHEDDSFGVVPLTKFVSPSLEDVHKNSECMVRWGGKGTTRGKSYS